MIDLITLTKNKVSELEVMRIVKHANLQECTRNGKTYYETSLQQRNKEHIYISVSVGGRLKIECNLHKMYEYTIFGHYTNYGLFSLAQAKKTAERLLISRSINSENLKIYGYEIGLNLNVENDCREYMDKMQSIGILADNKLIHMNPRYKDFRVLTTLFHRHVRKHYKIYDKCFEAHDKRRNDVPEHNILRIETVYKRVENMSYDVFFSCENLLKIQERFFRDWRRMQFTRDIEAPKGTGLARKRIIRTIVDIGSTDKVLDKYRRKRWRGELTEREFRTIREFICNEWEHLKKHIVFAPTKEEIEYRNLLNEAKKCMTKTTHSL